MMRLHRFPLAALLLAALAGATAAVQRPADLPAHRVIAERPMLSGEAQFGLEAAGETLHIEIRPGATLEWALDDGSRRYASAGSAEYHGDGDPLLPLQTRLLEVPPTGAVRLVVEELVLRPLAGMPALAELDHEGNLVGSRPAEAGRDAAVLGGVALPVQLGDPVIFRDLRLVPLSLRPIFADAEGLQLVERLRVRLETGAAAQRPLEGLLAGGALPPQIVQGNELAGPAHSWSSQMERVYAGLVENHGQFYDFVDDSVFPVYLIVGSPSYLDNPVLMAEFVRWKREKGFDVRIVPFDEIPGGSQTISFGALRDWMRQQWTELRPEVLLLVGDDDGAAACPDSVVASNRGEFNVSDHFYALQEGSDYFPELLVGRFSVDNSQQLFVMSQKPVIHEKTPYIAASNWLTKGLVVSCNYSDSGNHPVTPNLTSRWVIDKLRANGFTVTAADSIFFPPTPNGAASINAALNAGRGIVSYRGWANSNGWIFPAYERADIDDLVNVMKMPIVASFVCQTGAFGEGSSGGVTVEDPCFGEKFVRVGDPGAPKGAVAFVGPSDLHTRTQYNNPVCSGFFNAIFDLDQTRIGPALLNGKMELWRGYPNERSDPYGAYFYFHIYNVLGDPDLKIWRAEPRTFELTAPAALAAGQTILEVVARDADGGAGVDGAVATLVGGADGSVLLARQATRDGHALLSFDAAAAEAAGQLRLTVDHPDFLPTQRDYSADAAAQLLALEDLQIVEETPDGRYRGGETLELSPVLRNAGSAALPAGTVTLRAPADWPDLPAGYSVLQASAALPALASGAQTTPASPLRILLDEDVPHGRQLPLVFELAAGDYADLVVERIDAVNLNLSISSVVYASGLPLPDALGDTLVVVIASANEVDLADLQLTLSSEDERLGVVQGEAQVPLLVSGGEAELRFAVEAGATLFAGMAVSLRLDVARGTERAVLTVPLPTGERSPDDPWGPDAWGYSAIDSEDFEIFGRPEYDWIELDPAYGGSGGTRLYLTDDDVTTIEAPFPVTLYGRTESTLSVCSNGWISLGATWQANFRNWNLPSSLGPPSLICPFWDDLKPMYTVNDDSLFVPVFWRHDPDEGRLVISWSRTYNRYAWENPGQPLQEFQVVLYDQQVRPTPTGDTEILFQYKDVTDLDQNNNFATSGIENFGHSIGLQLNYAEHPSPGCRPLTGGRSVLLTTRPPQRDSALRVSVLEPRPQQWLNSLQPTIRWDHERFAQLLGGEGVLYRVSILGPDDALLAETEIVDAGEWDLLAAGIELPEVAGLRLRLEAFFDDENYPALQGEILFNIDATPPQLTISLLENGLFPHHLELGVFVQEPLGHLSALGLDAAGAPIAEFDQDAGITRLAGGRELRFLRAQLDERLALLRITAIDEHGLSAGAELPVAAAPGGSGNLAMPGAELAWSGQAAGWALLLGQEAGSGGPRFAAGYDQLELRLPAEGQRTRLAVEGRGVLVRLGGQGPEPVEQHREGTWIRALVEQSGSYRLVEEGAAPRPAAFRLHPARPNPFNPDTWFAFELPADGVVRLEIYNLAGQRVRTLHRGPLEAGLHQLRWDGLGERGESSASGLYIARLEWNGRQQTAKMLLVR
jgi:hypothetical protein